MPDMNEGKPWSKQDDADLLLEIPSGETIEHAATLLCRTKDEL
jgi:hypothetical protein